MVRSSVAILNLCQIDSTQIDALCTWHMIFLWIYKTLTHASMLIHIYHQTIIFVFWTPNQSYPNIPNVQLKINQLITKHSILWFQNMPVQAAQTCIYTSTRHIGYCILFAENFVSTSLNCSTNTFVKMIHLSHHRLNQEMTMVPNYGARRCAWSMWWWGTWSIFCC